MDNQKKEAQLRKRRPRRRPSVKRPPVKKTEDDFINPIDFWDVDINDVKPDPVKRDAPKPKLSRKGVVVIGTDSGVGKTIVIGALGTVLEQQQIKTAAFKPIECGGQDNQLFIEAFGMGDFTLSSDVYYLNEKTQPYFAVKKSGTAIDLKKIDSIYQRISNDHAVTFVEAPGGLMDPITEKMTTADIIKHLKLETVIVAPLNTGSLNHLIMTVDQMKHKKLSIRGIIFTADKNGIAKEKFLANVQAIQDLTKVPVIGLIPFLETGSREEVLVKCYKKISFKILLGLSFVDKGRPPSYVSAGASEKTPVGKPSDDKPAKKPSSRRHRRSRGRRRPPEK